MGYERSHAIVVSSFDEAHLARAHSEAKLFCGDLVSPIVPRRINGGGSFFVAPDGSKELWEESDLADTQRNDLIRWLDTQRYGDGSTPLDWVEVQFGDDEHETLVTRHSDEPVRRMPSPEPRL